MKFNKYFVLLFVLLFAFSVSAKSFSFSNVQTDYQIMDNGLVKVKESMKLNFSGDFHFGYRDIKLDNGNGQKIQNILVKVGGVVTPYKLQELGYEKIGSKELVEKRIYYEFSATNEAKEIVLEYELVNAVTVYNDGLEFFWKIWPEQWQEGVPELNGAIALPGKVADPKEVYSWGHPTVNGKLGLQDNQKLIFQVFNLPAQQFLEIRTFFPNTLKSTEFTLVKNENGLEKITEEENNQFYVGNILKFLLDIIPILILLLVPIIFITLWWVDGREPKIEYDAMYEREIPFNYSPAIVSALINQDSKKPNNESILGVIMHLCYKGYFKIEKYTPEKLLGIFGKNEDYKLVFQQRIISGHESELSWQEKKIFDIIMRASKSKDSTSFIELEKYMKNNTDIYHEIEEWKGDVKKEADEMDFFKKGFAQIAFTVLYVLALVANFFLMFSGSPTALVSFWVLLFSALLFFGVFREALPARTKKGAEHYLKWMKLKAFLKDFSQLSQVSPDAINLWDNFLVYAIPLGCAKEVQKAMDTAFANYSGDMHSSMFIGSYAAFNMSRFNSLGHSFNSAITSSSSTSGSSDFGGSGGGGGGGGGGGFG